MSIICRIRSHAQQGLFFDTLIDRRSGQLELDVGQQGGPKPLLGFWWGRGTHHLPSWPDLATQATQSGPEPRIDAGPSTAMKHHARCISWSDQGGLGPDEFTNGLLHVQDPCISLVTLSETCR